VRPLGRVAADAISERLRVLGQPLRARLLDVLEREGELAVAHLQAPLAKASRTSHSISRCCARPGSSAGATAAGRSGIACQVQPCCRSTTARHSPFGTRSAAVSTRSSTTPRSCSTRRVLAHKASSSRVGKLVRFSCPKSPANPVRIADHRPRRATGLLPSRRIRMGRVVCSTFRCLDGGPEKDSTARSGPEPTGNRRYRRGLAWPSRR